jgi:DNA-binding MarR family transcriptional regulator
MKPREALLKDVAQAIAQFQSATALVDEAATVYLGINRTDLRLLGLLYSQGPLNAGRLASAAGLSPGATTVAIDRLERAGYVQRLRADGDRRAIVVEATLAARERIEAIYGPVGRIGMERLARYSYSELQLLYDFLVEGHGLQVEQAARIRAMAGEADKESQR